MHTHKNVIFPLIFLFILLNALFLFNKSIFDKWGVDRLVLLGANLLFFSISVITFFMQRRAIKHSNPNVFVRTVMGGVMIKMFACLLALLAYFFLSGSSFNKPAIYGGMFIYLLYLVVEVTVLMKLNKKKHA